jgi:hypothetical protein
MQDEIDDWRLRPRRRDRRIAADRRANDREDARAYNGADAESRKRNRAKRLLQSCLRMFTLGDQLVDGLGGKDLARLRCAVAALDCGRQGVRSSLKEEWLRG